MIKIKNQKINIFFIILIYLTNQILSEVYEITKDDKTYSCKLCQFGGSFCCEENCSVCSFPPKVCWCNDELNNKLIKKEPLPINTNKSFEEITARSIDDIYKKAFNKKRSTLVVPGANDSPIIEAVIKAKELGIAKSILIGDRKQIEEKLKSFSVNTNDYEIIDEKNPVKSCFISMKLIHEGKADMVMKGLVESKLFLRSLLDKKIGLRTGKRISSVCALEIHGINRLLFLTDAGSIPYPSFEDKIQIIENSIQVSSACGIKNPKIAALCGTEEIDKKIKCTIEAAKLTQMNKNGQIKDCIIEGPLPLDLALDPESVVHKEILNKRIKGDADILLYPEIDTGNILYKALTRFSSMKIGCILVGVKVPVIFTSRSDISEIKINSIVLASLVSEEINKNKK